jgi:hypothetical protein
MNKANRIAVRTEGVRLNAREFSEESGLVGVETEAAAGDGTGANVESGAQFRSEKTQRSRPRPLPGD